MSRLDPDQVTRLLVALSSGNEQVAEDLYPLVYDELREIAARFMRGQQSSHTLQATALVNEAYLRMVDQTQVNWESRAHYLAMAARAMRSILVDHARRKAADKRGGGWRRTVVTQYATDEKAEEIDLLALEEALNKFELEFPKQAKTVELRFFGGLSVEECSRLLGSSTATVKRDWRLAKAWLKRELDGAENHEQ